MSNQPRQFNQTECPLQEESELTTSTTSFGIGRVELASIVPDRKKLDEDGIYKIERAVCSSLQNGIDTYCGTPHMNERRQFYGTNGFKEKQHRNSFRWKLLQGLKHQCWSSAQELKFVKVYRDGGKLMLIPECELVVGDIVLLYAMVQVPVDGIFFHYGGSTSILIREPSLIGHPEAPPRRVTRDAAHILRGSIVLEGLGRMMVTSVGVTHYLFLQN